MNRKPHFLDLETEQSEQNAQQVDEALGILKDDKEFEEFDKEDWSLAEEDTSDLHVWDQNWDPEGEVSDKLAEFLRTELAGLGYEASTN
ncbi:Pre-mRNA-splicing factor ATP-dependent RNA helicase PRP16 [Fasciolopsis buskii]|uniref:26S proteasome complex subunit SEM1 n=1 Tax=Fasciolopsis buskii TaxID=27845 RepID=A0A8E0S0J9_9TREM|nr:Pre-mRNA-splicing factor ATP-dependent RNA helicase PRP16 [Fasciolopsis buski]